MRVLNLLDEGDIGGIQQLCKCIGMSVDYENTYCILFRDGSISEEMKKEQIDVVSLSSLGKKRFSIKRLSALFKLARNYDIIVTHFCSIGSQFYYILIGKLLRMKRVMTVHSCFEENIYDTIKLHIKSWMSCFFLKAAINTSDRIIFVSKAGKSSYLKKFKFDESKAIIAYNGICSDMIKINKNYIVNENKKSCYTIAFIGRLEKVKGVHILLEAIKILKEKFKVNICAWIVGDGSFRADLERKAVALGITKEVHFEGKQRNITQYLDKTDVFVYPSVCQEVFGISIVEAMAHGVPCVAFSVGGIPEIIENGKNGLLVEEKTDESLAIAIYHMIEIYEKNEIWSMKERCIATAHRFDIENTVTILKNCFESIL